MKTKNAQKEYAAGGDDTGEKIVGGLFLLSAASGVFLLATDGSLWLLAASHAYGLAAMCGISIVMGMASLLGVRRMFSLAPVWAIGEVILQVGDLITAPAYNMTIPYFASYLFGLPAYDLLLATQFLILIAYYRTPRPKVVAKRGAYFEAAAKSERRAFLRLVGSIASFFVLTIVLAVIDLTSSQPVPSGGGSTTTSTTQTDTSTGGTTSGAIANVNDLQVGVPFSFNYPDSRHPNTLFKMADGSVKAFSALCTHVCCPLQYDATSKTFYCYCHGSIFDSNGGVVRGPAGYALPQVILQVDATGAITATGMSGTSPCVA